MTTTARTYRITNTEGKQGGYWSGTYASMQDAADALRVAMGWDSIALSSAYTADSDDSSAVSAYETQAECDADAEGSFAPRIVWR